MTWMSNEAWTKAHATTNDINCLKLKPNKPFNFEMKASFDYIPPCKIIFLDLIAIKKTGSISTKFNLFFILKIEKIDKIYFGAMQFCYWEPWMNLVFAFMKTCLMSKVFGQTWVKKAIIFHSYFFTESKKAQFCKAREPLNLAIIWFLD
jgi:hypothetical protein